MVALSKLGGRNFRACACLIKLRSLCEEFAIIFCRVELSLKEEKWGIGAIIQNVDVGRKLQSMFFGSACGLAKYGSNLSCKRFVRCGKKKIFWDYF